MQNGSINMIWFGAATILCLSVLFAALYYLFTTDESAAKRYVYKTTQQGNLSLYVHFPNDWQADDRRPVIVFFFGGGWISGGPDHFKRQATHLAKRGMVAIRADYRTDNKHSTTPDAAVADAHDALQWVREHATDIGIDRNRIVASGASAGGHLAACLALCEGATPPPSLLVLFNPVLDLRNATTELEFSQRELELINMIGPDAAIAISPNANVNAATPPSLHLIGDQDPLLVQVQDYALKSNALGIESRVLVAPEQKHGFSNKEPWHTATLVAMDDYLVAYGYLKQTDHSSIVEDAKLHELSIDAHPNPANHQ